MKINNIRFYFYSNEGKRPHIHVALGDYEVQVWLDDLSVKKGCDSKNVQNRMVKLVSNHQGTLLDSWNEYFGVEDEH